MGQRPRMVLTVVALMLVTLTGCASMEEFFYKKVTTIELDRDQFIMFARVQKVAYDWARPQIVEACARGSWPPEKCVAARQIDEELKPIWVQYLAVEAGAPASKFDIVKALELVGKLVGLAL